MGNGVAQLFTADQAAGDLIAPIAWKGCGKLPSAAPYAATATVAACAPVSHHFPSDHKQPCAAGFPAHAAMKSFDKLVTLFHNLIFRRENFLPLFAFGPLKVPDGLLDPALLSSVGARRVGGHECRESGRR